MTNSQIVTVRVPPDLHRALYRSAERTGVPVGQIVREALGEHLDAFDALAERRNPGAVRKLGRPKRKHGRHR